MAKKKKYINQSEIPIFKQIDRPVSEENTQSINKILIDIRKFQLSKKSDPRIQTKMKHFNKMFRSINDDDSSNFIEFFIKSDDWLNKQ